MFEVTDPRFEPHQEPTDEPAGTPPPERREAGGRGCLFWGCLTAAVLMLLLVIGVPLAIYFTARHYVGKFTAEQPAPIEVVELPEERLAAVRQRFNDFEAALEADGPRPDLELTAEELNGLIAANEDLRGKVFVRVEDGRVGGDISFPADDLPGGEGRYFNASVDFNVWMRDGDLHISLADAEVNGAKLPAEVLVQLSDQNLAEEINDPEARETIEKFESLEVVGDKIILRAKRDPAAEGDAQPAAEIESFEEAEPASPSDQEPRR